MTEALEIYKLLMQLNGHCPQKLSPIFHHEDTVKTVKLRENIPLYKPHTYQLLQQFNLKIVIKAGPQKYTILCNII